ncbi:MAG: GtrA family protein [Nitrososphaerales archaeon]
MRGLLLTEDSSPRPSKRWWRALDSLGRKYGVLRISKFAAASGIGFLVAEAILVLGVAASYRTIEVPSLAYSSPTILGLDTLALGIGVTVAFMINERVTVKRESKDRVNGGANWLVRWCKYQLASLLGNTVIVGVQLALLVTFSLSPAFGSIVGAIVSYPLTYVVSMRFVWGVHPLREGTAPL